MMLEAGQNLRLRLLAGLQTLQLNLDGQQIDQLLAYQALIGKWTQVYNLTSVREPAEMLTHHLLDSLAAIPALQRHLQEAGLQARSRLLDVGSGAGLPGVIIAICCPAIAVTCVDSVAKKAAFIKQVALALKLDNLLGLHARVEDLSETFDIICSRAFASLSDFTRVTALSLASDAVWMAMKGRYPIEELAELPASVEMFHVEQLHVPELQSERCIVWLRPAS